MRTILSVSLPARTAAELDAYARCTGRNKSDIVKEALGVFLWEARLKKLKKGLGRKAKAAKIVSEDDVFKAVS